MNLRTTNKFQRSRANAFTAVELIVTLVVIGLLLVVLLPVNPPTRRNNIYAKCRANLKQIGLVFFMWEEDHNGRYPMAMLTNNAGGPLYTKSTDSFRYFKTMSEYFSGNMGTLVCPGDKKRRHPATNFDTDFNGTHLGYFVGLSANKDLPQSLLAGDSHLTNGQMSKDGLMVLTSNSVAGWSIPMHGSAGNFAMADGSVIGTTTASLQQFLKRSSMTNRILLPPDL